ncbi:MAG TPA: GNAT family N-acetyltransferase [Candidatus Eremiobacteraceae bacterium]
MLALQTERLELEPLIPAHAKILFPQMRDARLYEFLDSEPPRSVAILETQYRRWEPRRSPDGTQAWLNWAARLRSGEYIGWFQATVYDNHRADLAYLVFMAHQRHGYAIEACRAVVTYLSGEYGVRTIRTTIDKRNTASIALARTLDLTQSGADAHGIWFEKQIPGPTP